MQQIPAVATSPAQTISNKLPFEYQSKDILMKKSGPTNPAYGKRPGQRTAQELLASGIVIIDKPKGPTSHQVSEWTKIIAKANIAGHSGTLDPIVTGILPVCLNDATKIIQAIHVPGKEYVCLMHIHQEVSEEKIRATINEFVGKIEQMPPVKSAVKRVLRTREIYYIQILDIIKNDVLYRVGCESGTYIRKLCTDIGEKLGTGAHMQQLIRTRVATFTDKQMTTMQTFTDAMHFLTEGNEAEIKRVVLPVEAGVAHLKKVWIFDSVIGPMCTGAALAVPGISKLSADIVVGDMIALMSLKDELVSIATAKMNSADIHKNSRGIAATTLRVIMKDTVYPKGLAEIK